jgi:hypothetical protein
MHTSFTVKEIKMADDEGDTIENALNTVVITLEKMLR